MTPSPVPFELAARNLGDGPMEKERNVAFEADAESHRVFCLVRLCKTLMIM